MFWENFLRLCNKNEEKPNQVAKKIGIPSGSITNWKNGMAPRSATALKIADYFGVTVEELLGDASLSQKEKPTAEDGEPISSKKEESVMELFRQVPEEEQPAVLEALGVSLAALGKVPEDQREIAARLIVASLNK